MTLTSPAVDPVPVATGRTHPDDDTLTLFTSFTGFVKTFKADPMTGEMILTIAVPGKNKHDAFRMTDHMGARFVMDVFTAPRRRVWADGREHDAKDKLEPDEEDIEDDTDFEDTDTWETR